MLRAVLSGTAAGSVNWIYFPAATEQVIRFEKKKISPLPFPPTQMCLTKLSLITMKVSLLSLVSFLYLPLPNLTLALFPRQLIVPLTQPPVPVITDRREWSYIGRQWSPEPWRTHKLTYIVAGLVTCVLTSQNRASASSRNCSEFETE
jgi:hypothetical protein